MFGWITEGVTGILKGANGIVKTVIGSTEQREAASHVENLAGLDQYKAEYTQLMHTKFDSFVNGVNRLMRPSAFFTFMCLLWYALADPKGFTITIASLALVPETIWYIIGGMITFLFPSRILEKKIFADAVKDFSVGKAKARLELAKEIDEFANDTFIVGTDEDLSESIKTNNKSIELWKATQ